MTASSRQWSVVSKNVFCFVLGAMLLALCVSAEAQQSKKIPRIGFLFNTFPADFASRIDVLRRDLHELGYVEGKTILFEFRYAEGNFDRLPELAAELVRLNVDIIVVSAVDQLRPPSRPPLRFPLS